MKVYFINKSLSFLCRYKNYTKEEKDKLLYGLEGIYLTITKLIIIILISLILNIFKEVIILLFLFNIIRYFGFGIHAGKSSDCLITSICLFILLPYVSLKLNITKNILYILSSISLVSFIPWAPADTIKRPFNNKKKKLIRKILTILVGSFYFILSFIIKNNVFSRLLLLAIIIQGIVINPLSYKILRQPYHNGK